MISQPLWLRLLIAAKRSCGPVSGGRPVLCGADGEFTASNHVAQMRRIVGQHLPIDLPCVNDTEPLFGTATYDECLLASTIRFERAVVATAEHVFQRLRPGVAQFPGVAEITTIVSTHQCYSLT